MGKTSDVTVRLSAEGKQQLIAALRDVGGEGEKMARQLEKSSVPPTRGLLAINAAAAEARNGITNLSGRAGATGAVLSSMGVAGTLAAAGLAAVGVAAAVAFTKAREGMDFADEVDTASKRLGIGAEALQEYRAALVVAGDASADFDDAAKTLLERMGEFARTGTGAGAQVFKKLGLDVRDANGHIKSLEAFLPELSDKIKALGSEAEQADIANQLFGGQGQNMLAIMRNGGTEMGILTQQMRDMGVVMDAEVVKRYAEASDKAQILSKAIDVQLTSAFVDIAPVIVESLQWLAKFSKSISDIADQFHSLENMSFDGLSSRLDEMVKKRAELVRNETKGTDANFLVKGLASIYGGTLDGGQAQIASLDEQIARAQAELKRREGRRPVAPSSTGASTPDDAAIANAKRDTDAIAALQLQLDHFADKRQLAIDSAMSRLSNSATDKQRQELADLAGKLYDVTAAEKAHADAIKLRDKAMSDGKSVRESVMTDAEKLSAEYSRLSDLLSQGAISSGTFDRALQQAREQYDPTTRAIKEMSDGLAQTALSSLASARSFKDLGGVLDQLATQFLNMVLQMVAYQPLQSATSSFLTSIISPSAHGGGIAGERPGTRTVSPLIFAGAPRFHTGGIAGLGPNEMPIIVRPEEEILTRQNPRHILNQSSRSSAKPAANDNVTINVYPTAGTQADISTSRDQNGGLQVDVMMRQMEDRMAGRIGQGKSTINGAMERRYGLNPARSFQR